ncbi:hypothetical protein N0V90_004840 [Kalmusia sp. IMI 367209]|nr:hypothetical protein N0V90_004840 [Kalmusia sp. IMI 367209]
MADAPDRDVPLVAIPKLERHDHQAPFGEKNARDPRVARAVPRRDRLKSVTSKNKNLVNLLRELSLRVNNPDKALIIDALDEYEDDTGSVVSAKSAMSKRRKLSIPEEPYHEDDYPLHPSAPHAQTLVGVDDGIARVHEDLLRDRKSRETGYVGQGAEVHWLRSLQDRLGTADQARLQGSNHRAAPSRQSEHTEGAPAASYSEATFYLDSDSAELDVMVDPYELPPPELAEKLLECYMRTVHKSFPILPAQFEEQFRRFFDAFKSKRPFQVPDKWLAILNIVFAIGARYSHLINADWQGEERDHLVYMARTLRLLGSWPFSAAPDLALIQASGLLSLYYQVIGHVSRAWVVIGIAIRLALALGLHLRNEDPKIPFSRKETLIRTWWSLHAIECLLSAITGRPCVLGHEDCTVPLPVTLSEEKSRSASPADYASPFLKDDKSPTPASSSTSEKTRRLRAPRSYLDAHLNIGLITQKLLSALYSPRTAQRSWEYIQRTIPTLLEELEEWKRGALPDENRLFVQPFPPPDGPRETHLLRFYYFSTQILITRPCLCRYGRKIEHQSHASAKFDQQTAEACVEAALGLVKLLPDDTNPQVLYENGPWWSITHNVMQAMAVLLLELSHCEKHMRSNHTNIRSSVKKLIRWLRALRTSDAVVERAYKVIVNILHLPQIKASAAELLAEDNDFQGKRPNIPAYFTNRHSEQAGPSETSCMPQAPPSQWYGGHYPPQRQTGAAGFNPSATDPQFMVDLVQPQVQQQANAHISQPQPQSEHFDLLGGPIANSSMFSSPFMTSHDQDAPFGLSLNDFWSQVGTMGPGDFGEQDDPNYQMYSPMMDQNQPQGQQPPQ